MNIIYLSNTSIKCSTALCSDRDIKAQIDTIIKTDEDRIYVIDVHLRSKNYQSLEDQGGLATYRYLIDKYTNAERKASYPLKVVFYSPLSALQLSHKKLKSQNYVLNILPFIQLNAGNDFSFELKLAEFLSPEFIFPKFNNTSENLLAGWACNGAKAFKFQDKKILFIDDESEEWKSTLDVILDGQYAFLLDGDQKTCRSKFEYLFPLKKDDESDEEFENRESNLDGAIRNCIHGFDLIISDFYILENHNTNFIQDIDKLSEKSGARLFNRIRELDPFIPFIFHTTSNKIQYYKFFDSLGVDNWVVKQSKFSSTKYAKQLYYRDIIDSLNYILYGNKSEWYVFLREKYNQINEIKKQSYWWSDLDKVDKDLYIAFLIQNWSLLRQMVNREIQIDKKIAVSKQNMLYSLICSIISNLYKIIEDLKERSSSSIFFEVEVAEFPMLLSFLKVLRNVASHITYTNHIQIEDAFLYFDLMIEFLLNSHLSNSTKPQYVILGNELNSEKFVEKQYFSVILPYLNLFLTLDNGDFKERIKNRIKKKGLIKNFNYSSANSYYKEIFDFKNHIDLIIQFLFDNQIVIKDNIVDYKNQIVEFNNRLSIFKNDNLLNFWKFKHLRIESYEISIQDNMDSINKYINNHLATLNTKKSQIELLLSQFVYNDVDQKYVLNFDEE